MQARNFPANDTNKELNELLLRLKNVDTGKLFEMASYEQKKLHDDLSLLSVLVKNSANLVNLTLNNDLNRFLISLIDALHVIYSDNKSSDNKLNSFNNILAIYLIAISSFNALRAFSHASTLFSESFQQHGGIEMLFNRYIKNEAIVKQHQNSFRPMRNKEEKFGSNKLLTILLDCIQNLSLASVNHLNRWRSVEAVNVLIVLSEKLADDQENLLSIYMCLANIASDEEIDKLKTMNSVISTVVDLIRLAADQFEKGRVKRHEFYLSDSTKPEFVCIVTKDNCSWSIVELLEPLYHMCVNDKLKYEVYEKHAMSKHLRSIIYKGNTIEIAYALKVLWQLCYDNRVIEVVSADSKLVKFIENQLNSENSNLQKHSQGIMWLLSAKKGAAAAAGTSANIDKIDDNNNGEENKKEKQKHIMISYNIGTRDICLKVKEELEKLGYKIWIDVIDIHGSSLDSMAKAVENSFCVLVCMTEKYKNSNNCRLEAEYTIKLNKPFVPLIMQQSYKPDGWLGIILGTKIYVDFTKNPFDICMTLLHEEIKEIESPKDNNLKMKPPIKTITAVATEPLYALPPQTSAEKPITQTAIPPTTATTTINANKELNSLKWTTSQVDAWLSEKNIHMSIRENIFPCDGQTLNQIFLMHKTAPEFFYVSIVNSSAKKEPVLIKDLAYFIVQLKSLYEN